MLEDGDACLQHPKSRATFCHCQTWDDKTKDGKRFPMTKTLISASLKLQSACVTEFVEIDEFGQKFLLLENYTLK